MPYKYFTQHDNEFNYKLVYFESLMDRFFDNIYLLNLHKRTERLKISEKRLQFVDIENYEVFGAVDGSVLSPVWQEFNKTNSYFKNPSYLGCALSHLSIYTDAIEKGYKKILILEDDCRVHRNAQEIFKNNLSQIPEEWELLYLGYIPLSDDLTRWDYGVFSDGYISKNIFTAKNLWGLYSYAISDNLMKELLSVYDKKFPMELDRYFVSHVQPRKKCYGMSPQLFCAEDGYSDNSKIIETSMIQRSVDIRFSQYTDYV